LNIFVDEESQNWLNKKAFANFLAIALLILL